MGYAEMSKEVPLSGKDSDKLEEAKLAITEIFPGSPFVLIIKDGDHLMMVSDPNTERKYLARLVMKAGECVRPLLEEN